MSFVLGLNDPWHDSSFCIHLPDRLTHIEMERFTRSKYEQLNPVLGFINLHPELILAIEAFAIEEGEFLAPFVRQLLSEGDAGLERFAASIVAQAVNSPSVGSGWSDHEIDLLRQFGQQLLRRPVEFYGHHLCHAANALFSSEFDEALTIILDGGGLEVINGARKTVHSSVWKLSRKERSIPPPVLLETAQSIGLAWSRVREIVGLRDGEEGTVMAMAAYGSPSPAMDSLVANDLLWMPMTSELPKSLARSVERFVASVAAAAKSEESQFSLASALQKETEERVRRFLAPYLEKYSGDLCLSGGVFLNCQVTGKIKKWFPLIQQIYIPPAPYDGGVSIGAAQLYAHCSAFDVRPADAGPSSFATGRSFSRIEIIGAVRAHGCNWRSASFEEIGRLLNAGAVLGIFQGPAESGRRALGNRSIIADPRRPQMRDHINSLIKHRQWFRPFAPMILAEHVGDWFETEDGFASPYMSFAVPVRQEKRQLVPAIVHKDGTARVQTVHAGLTPRIHKLLKIWQQISGIPLLLNTSFNDREPIVEKPSDALATFLRLPLDGIYFADYEILVNHTDPADKTTSGSSRTTKSGPGHPLGRIRRWLENVWG